MLPSLFRRSGRGRLVWAVPALTVTVVVASALVTSTAYSSPHPALPARTAGQLLAELQSSQNVSLSGTIVQTARLGLPSLPGGGGGASLSWQSLLTGSHTAQVWLDGPERQRVAVKAPLSESDVIHNGTDLWTYTSDANEVSHTILRKDAGAVSPTGAAADARSLTPSAVAQQALKAINPSTVVTVDSTQRVAGQKAYTLVLTPRDARSTVSKVTIAIDSTHFVPLQVQIFGAGSTPALETGFTDTVSFAKPKAAVFNFHVPAGATVSTDPFGLSRSDRARVGTGQNGTDPKGTPGKPGGVRPTLIGSGWTSVVEFASGLPTGSTTSLLGHLTTAVSGTGDRLLTTSLVNVLFTKDGRVFLGAVSAAMLEHTAAATPR